MDVEFSSLLCKSQGMVTINILYSLKSSKNTVLGGGGGVHFLLLGVYKRAVLCRRRRRCSYLHIYKYWGVQ